VTVFERWPRLEARVVRLQAWVTAHWPYLAAAGFGFAIFCVIGGDRILLPTHTRWIKPGTDWGYHWVGWLFFRKAPWGFPIGDTPNLFHPVGTTVGFMDGIPWLAVTAKIVSPILPDNWQHIGLWLAACFTLQGWFGARLTATVTESKPAIALGGALLTFTPVLVHRLQHEALCAHFLIVAALALLMRRDGKKPGVGHVVLPVIAIGVHPYIAVLVCGIVFASLAGELWTRRIPWRGVLWRAAAAFGATAVLAWMFGYFSTGFDALQAKGFGKFNAEMLSLVNPRGGSRVLRDYAIKEGQDEGYGYVGLGVLVMALSALPLAAYATWRRAPTLPWRRIAPFVLVVVAFTLFAFASNWSAHGETYKDLRSTFEHFGRLRGTFRSSGRFIWMASYAVTVAAMALWLVRAPKLAPWVLGGCLVLQLADFNGLHTDHFGSPKRVPKQAPEWALARGDYDHMALYPPRCGDPNGPCCTGFTTLPKPGDLYLAELAANLDLTYNGFGAARVPRKQFAPWCAAFDAEIQRGQLDPRTIYVVSEKRQVIFTSKNPTAPCRKLDKELVCVSPDATGPFRDALGSRPEPSAPASP
jgi:hypothetical protein